MQTLNNPAEFANALHEGRIAECLETINALDAQLENPEPSRKAKRRSAGKSDPARRKSCRRTARLAKSESALERHMRKCSICKHPDREAIEADFINWRSEETICEEFSLSSRTSIYRHAAATGLLRKRRLNLRGVCERIIEHAEKAPPSASAILRALRIFAHITEDGQWLEPAKRFIVTCVHVTKHEPAPAAAASSEPSENGGAFAMRDSVPAASASYSQSSVNSTGAPRISETSSSEYFSEKIIDNCRDHNDLPAYSGAKILIGTQNASPEESIT